MPLRAATRWKHCSDIRERHQHQTQVPHQSSWDSPPSRRGTPGQKRKHREMHRVLSTTVEVVPTCCRRSGVHDGLPATVHATGTSHPFEQHPLVGIRDETEQRFHPLLLSHGNTHPCLHHLQIRVSRKHSKLFLQTLTPKTVCYMFISASFCFVHLLVCLFIYFLYKASLSVEKSK